MTQPIDRRADTCIEVVLDLLERDGYRAVQVRTVARRAHVSLATIYKLFGSRDALVVSAMERWMEQNTYSEASPRTPNETPYDWLMRVIRTVFAPWERNPKMLDAFVRASRGPGGSRLVEQGQATFVPLSGTALGDLDPGFVDDLAMIQGHVLSSALDAFANGDLTIEEVVQTLERTLFRVFTGDRAVV
jgi:AcrR family transcriptional regulator